MSLREPAFKNSMTAMGRPHRFGLGVVFGDRVAFVLADGNHRGVCFSHKVRLYYD